MPRSGGTYSIPLTLTAGDTARASDMNTNFSDLGAEITNSVALDGQSTLTGQLKAANGSVAAPGITFGADLDNGLYRKGANNPAMAAGGGLVQEWTTSGSAITGTFAASGAVTGASLGGTLELSDVDIVGGTALTAPAVADLVPVYDDSATANRGVTIANFFKVIALLTAETAPATDDIILLSDTSDSAAANAITVANLFKVINAFTAITALDNAADYAVVFDATDSLPKKVLISSIAAAVSGKVLIHAQDASTSATIDFNQTNSPSAFDGTYDYLELVISSAKPVSDDVEAWLRVGTGATPTYQADAADYAWTARWGQAGSGTADTDDGADAQINLTNQSATKCVGNATGECFNAVISCNDLDAANLHTFRFKADWTAAVAALAYSDGAGRYETAEAITAIRFLFESGNIASGHFALYGYKRA